jgi:hypothetical protein
MAYEHDPNKPTESHKLVTPTIAQPVWYYAEHARTKGMKSHDWDVPFAAMVVYVWSDRLVNLLVIDHEGKTFAMSKVPLHQGDDEDDQSAPFYCSLEAPKPKEAITVEGVEGEPIPLELDMTAANMGNASSGVGSVKLTFSVMPGATYTFTSDMAPINQSFGAAAAPQTLAITSAQIAAGALSDLSLTTNLDGEVSLSVAVIEQTPTGVAGRTYTFTEIVTVTTAPEAEPEQPADNSEYGAAQSQPFYSGTATNVSA